MTTLTTPADRRIAREVRAEKKAREHQRIRADLETLIERVRDSDLPDRDVALGHLGQARGWLRVRDEHRGAA